MMLNRMIQSALLVGVVGAVAIATPAQAQVTVTGGNINFQGTQIYVPNSLNSNGVSSVIYNGSGRVIVNTAAVPSINNTILINSGIVPSLSTAPGSIPAVNDTGKWLTTLTFLGRSSSGEPTLFANIPAQLNFTITGLTPTGESVAINRFESFPFLLSQSGVAVNASSFGGVERITPVVLLDFGQTPSASLTSIGVASTTPGTNYPDDIKANITGGTISTPLTNSIGGLNSSPSGNGASNNGSNGSFTVSAATYIGEFNSVTSIFSIYGPTAGSSTPSNQDSPTPTPPRPDDKSGREDNQDDDTIFVDRTSNVRVVVVGLPSRVFPGVIGVEVIRGN